MIPEAEGYSSPTHDWALALPLRQSSKRAAIENVISTTFNNLSFALQGLLRERYFPGKTQGQSAVRHLFILGESLREKARGDARTCYSPKRSACVPVAEADNINVSSKIWYISNQSPSITYSKINLLGTHQSSVSNCGCSLAPIDCDCKPRHLIAPIQ